MTAEDPTAKARRVWDAYAPRYDRAMRFAERYQFKGGREWVCTRAWGDVLEVAVGTGSNFPLYPDSVRLTAVDLSPEMLAVARSRAAAVAGARGTRRGRSRASPRRCPGRVERGNAVPINARRCRMIHKGPGDLEPA